MDVSHKLRDFANNFISNDVLNAYLFYMGVKTLTTATLVPIALILGQEAFQKAVETLKEKSQTGGDSLLKDVPILNDPLVGNYLKLAGLTTVSLTPETLIPLGLLMFIYELYIQRESQKGGNLGKHVKRVWGNRVLDLFLKYLGVKTLTTVTLVPFALILGKDMLEKVLKGDKQVGGHILSKKIPVVDDPLLGNYLKLAGLSLVSLTPQTLIPLGLVAILYHIYMGDENGASTSGTA